MRKKRLLRWQVVGVTVLAAAAVGAYLTLTPTSRSAAAAPAAPASTARIERRTLVNTISVSGTITYAAPAVVNAPAALPGSVYTWLPAAGAQIRSGQTLVKVNNAPVVLLRGAVPAWRDLGPGVSAGPDVAELQHALRQLGLEPGRSRPTVWDSVTTAAVDKLQARLGIAQTGRLLYGSVIFEPYDLRVSSVVATLGAAVASGPMLNATSTDRIVEATVPVADEYLLHQGDQVTMTTPSGSTAGGRISSIGKVVTRTQDASGNSTSAVTATIKVSRAADLGAFDQAPVTVSIVSESARDVLTVPVTALVASPGGGYSVWVDAGGIRRQVAVTPGLFSSSLVEIHGNGIKAGDRVEVPSS